MSSESGSVKCFSWILRCLLCKGSLPTHPSDHHFVELSNASESKYQRHATDADVKKKPLVLSSSSNCASPGVVARLMGLESLPHPMVRNKSTLGSYLRSRSVNSIDFLSHLEFKKQGGCINNNQLHRRVRTSVSFRNDDYYNFVLEEVVDENDEFRNELKFKRRPKLDRNVEKNEKQKKRIGKFNERRVTAKVLPVKKVEVVVKDRSAGVKPSSSGDVNVARSQRENGKTRPRLKERRTVKKPLTSKEESSTGSSESMKSDKKIVAQKMCSENSLKKVHPEDMVVQELAKSSFSKRSSLSSDFAKSKSSYTNSLHSDDGEARALIEGKAEKRKMVKSEEKCYYKRLVEVICNLTEESLDKNWKMTLMHGDGVALRLEDAEEVCKQLEGEILEDILTQFVVDELVMIYGSRI